MKTQLVFTPFLFVFLIGCSQTSSVHKFYGTPPKSLDTISIIFPHVEYVEKTKEIENFKQGPTVFVSWKIMDILKTLINNEHLLAGSAYVVYDSTVIDNWMPRHFSNSVRLYKNFNDSLKSMEDAKKYFKVTPELLFLIDKAPTKYFLFVHGSAFGTSEETKRYDFQQAQTFKLFYDHPFAYDYQWSGLRLHFYLIDKQTMEISWYNTNDPRDTRYDPIKEEEVKELCRKLLRTN